MVTSISSTSATQAAYAPAAKKNAEATAVATAAVPAEQQDTAAAATQSQASAASTRLADQLSAQADASRVQRAVDDSAVAPNGPPPAPPEEASADSDAAADTETAAAQAPAGGARPAGGAPAAAASSETTATDYIAEADTNSDKTVSDEERAAYETKLRQQAEDAGSSATKSATQADPVDALTAEVRATYGVDEAAEPSLNITA